MSEKIEQEGEFKVSKKRGRPKKLNKTEESVKVEIKKEDKVEEKEEVKLDLTEVKEEVTEVEEQTNKEDVSEQQVVEIQEITETEKGNLKTTSDLPESVEKLVNFMKDTGGSLEDYMRLNADYSKVDESQLLREYYKNTKPHLESDEIDFLLKDKFSWDTETEDERTVKLKKLSYKEEIASAKKFLEDLKSKYYEEIKLNSKGSKDKLELLDKYNKEQQVAREKHEKFTLGTKKYFGEDFKGFDFNVSDKKFRFKINNTESVANSQSNLNNFVEKFFNKEGELKSYNDYHKAIYAAENADTIASHFYEQGKTDALKNMMDKSKNIDDSPRSTSNTDVTIGGFKVKAVSGVDSSRLRIKNK
jgi:hypothetical protein